MNRFIPMVEKHRQQILDSERWLWKHPQTGYKEWEANNYIADIFEKAGYTLVRAGNIPGFYTDLDTGRPGPKVLIMGELDALPLAEHPESVNGCAHACGHNAQGAALIGIALALKEEGALDGLSGSVRLMAVPAEELVEIEYREELRKQGIIHSFGGKVEFMHRGYMNDVDIAYMIHAGGWNPDVRFNCGKGQNGAFLKNITYTGKAAHAGGSPQNGINALYAATLGMQAINSLRETFVDSEHIRVHPIMTEGGKSTNIIPAVTRLSTYVRGNSMKAIESAGKKVDRAIAAGALAMGAKVLMTNRMGYAPLQNSVDLRTLAAKCMSELVGPEHVEISEDWSMGSTDMGDLSTVMPVIHPHIAGATGSGHGIDYQIKDPEMCILSAEAQLMLMEALLKDDAAAAKQIKADFKPVYSSIDEYFAVADSLSSDVDLVEYHEDGTTTIYA